MNSQRNSLTLIDRRQAESGLLRSGWPDDRLIGRRRLRRWRWGPRSAAEGRWLLVPHLITRCGSESSARKGGRIDRRIRNETLGGRNISGGRGRRWSGRFHRTFLSPGSVVDVVVVVVDPVTGSVTAHHLNDSFGLFQCLVVQLDPQTWLWNQVKSSSCFKFN